MHPFYDQLLEAQRNKKFDVLHERRNFFYDRTRTHSHSETLSYLYLSRLSLARTLRPIQRLELAGARFFTAFSGTHSFWGPVTGDVWGGNNRTIIVASQGVKTSEPRQRQGAQECGCRDRL